MDQRVDSERRAESAPGRSLAPVADKSSGRRSWGEAIREHWLLTLVIIAAVIIAAIALVLWWLNARQYETTDDAFIDARTVQISAQVAAEIVEVPVTDNQMVEAGTVLARLDDRDFKASLDEAKAQVKAAEAGITNLKAQVAAQDARIEQAKKQVDEAKAALTFAQQQANRYQLLAKQGSATVEQAEQYTSNLLQKQAVLDAAESNAEAAEKQKPVLAAQQELSEAELLQRSPGAQQAETNLSRTIITAPVAGRVVHLTAAKGGYAAVGQALMMFVPREVWVTANFKETQLDLMRPGEPVTIQIDAYPDRTFNGHVDSVQAGSGTAFSLLPAENATGNYVKIVQRVPVKIVFNTPPDVLLGPGMSVVPTVKVR